MSASRSTEHALSIASWNCDGIVPHLSGGKSAPLATVAERLGMPDVLCLQELRLRPQDDELVAAMAGALPGYACVYSLCNDPKNATFRGGRMYGVATWIKSDLEPSRAYRFPWDLEGRAVVVEIGEIAIVNVYAVNGTDKPYWDHDLGRIEGDRHAFKRRWNVRLFEECAQLRVRDPSLELVMLGDWNVSRTRMDTFPRLRTEEPHALARKVFNDELMPRLDVVDAFRELHPDVRKYTWFKRGAPPGRLDAARVDFALVSRSLLTRVESADILDSSSDRWLSDHAPLTLRLRARANDAT